MEIIKGLIMAAKFPSLCWGLFFYQVMQDIVIVRGEEHVSVPVLGIISLS